MKTRLEIIQRIAEEATWIAEEISRGSAGEELIARQLALLEVLTNDAKEASK